METEAERINAFIDTIINCDILDECFAGFSILDHDLAPIHKEVLTEQIVNIYSIISKQDVDDATRVYIASISKITNYNQSSLLFSFLETLIQRDLIAPKEVCCHILSFDFDFKSEVFWVNGLEFIRKIIHLVNYKGVRDILAILLSKISTIPVQSKQTVHFRIDALYKLVNYIFDRKAALLPAYLVLDEIQKKSQVLGTGHWKFSKKISSFIDSFRLVAKIVWVEGRPKMLPIIGYPSLRSSPFKWDHNHAKYRTKCLLPFDKELGEPNYDLYIHVLGQLNSKSVWTMSGKNTVLERSLVKLVIQTIMHTGNVKSIQANANFEDNDLSDPELCQNVFLWQHLATTLLYLEWISQNSHFIVEFIQALQQQIQQFNATEMKSLHKSREFLSWLLLEIISIYLPKNVYEGLGTLFNFVEILYPEKESLPLPDFGKQNSIYIMSAASIWCLISKKGENASIKIPLRLPKALRLQVEAIQKQVSCSDQAIDCTDLQAVPLINSVDTNSDNYPRVFEHFTDNVVGFRLLKTGDSSLQAFTPVSMAILDSLTATSKISLLKYFTTQFVAMAQSETAIPLPLLETYHRLLIYTEVELNGIKDFINIVLHNVMKKTCMNHLLTFVQLFSFRLFSYHVNLSYKHKFLHQLHQYFKSSLAPGNYYQVFLYLESAILKFAYSFNSFDFLYTPASTICTFAMSIEGYCDTQELSKVFVMAMARAIHITGSEHLSPSVIDLLKSNAINLTWPNFTLKCFPSIISEFYQQQAEGKVINESENRNQLKMSVEEDYRKWKSMSNEADLVKHFTSITTPPYFYCFLYKMLLEDETLNQTVYMIMDKIGVKSLCTHLRTFAIYLVNEFANLRGDILNKSFDVIHDLIWKWNVFTIDRLLLCLTLCQFDGNEVQVSIFIIQTLLFKKSMAETQPNELHNIVIDFVTDHTPDHWTSAEFCEKQMQFARKHPEKFYFEHLTDLAQNGHPDSVQHYLPDTYGNVCLRILPVFDLILHRLIELQPNSLASKTFESLLDQYGCLYKFHYQPITFLYNTLHYYESILGERTEMKRNLVLSVINAFNEIRPKDWALSEMFVAKSGDEPWNAALEYYKQLVARVVDTLSTQARYPFPTIDYRFNEFPNVGTHALYVTCVELMSLPVSPKDVANSLISLVLHNHKYFAREDAEALINAVALILVTLPESYSSLLNDRIVKMLEKPECFEDKNMFYLFDYKSCHLNMYDNEMSNLIALWHAFWNHANTGLFLSMPTFLNSRITPIIESEEQFIFVCYMIGPFLQRFVAERTRCMIDIIIELYDMLVSIDKKCTQLKYIDTICDFLYHNKYMFTGDLVKKDIEIKIQAMRDDLKFRLRFM